MIVQNLSDERFQFLRRVDATHGRKWVAVSGGFDPLHIGHVRNLQEARLHGHVLIAIVNGDGFLQRKKGYVFMPLEERMEIVAALGCVDFVVPWDDGSQFVAGALELIKPDLFAKGGDRSSPAAMASDELEVCERIGCRIEYGVGGTIKVQSSSWLVNRERNINASQETRRVN